MLTGLIYNKEKGLRKTAEAASIAEALQSPRDLVWVDITNPSETDIDLMVETFEFHQLSIEDSIFPQNHPKMEDYGEYLFIVVHAMALLPQGENKLISRELNIFVGKNYVVTTHGDEMPPVAKLFQRCQANPNAMQQGAGFLLHAVIDNVVDGYFPVVDQLEDRIEQLEDRVLAGADDGVLEGIVDLKKNVLVLRNFLAPQRRLLSLLARSNTPFIKRAAVAYFRDVYDHVERVNSLVDTYRDILNSTMEAYLSVVSHRLNEIMKTLTIIATVMMPLTLITSFYGMNVKLPEFGWGFKGYLFVLGLLLLAVVMMVVFLKRRKWI